VAESSLIKNYIVYAGGGNPTGGVDECMEAFSGCEGKMEEIVDGGAQMTRAAVRNGDLVFGVEEGEGCLVFSTTMSGAA
jgi:hypothetical protein